MPPRKFKKSEKNKHYNWLMAADMYLVASVILCEELSKSYTSPKKHFCNIQRIDEQCGFSSRNPDYEMLMPIVFNLKHGIELYLKALIMRINKSLQYPLSHNLLDLLNELMKEVLNKKEKSILSKLDKIVRPLIEKYYYGLYAFAEYKIFPDRENEAERFPEYRNVDCYKIDNLYDIVDSKLIGQIKKDTQDIQKILRDILKDLCM